MKKLKRVGLLGLGMTLAFQASAFAQQMVVSCSQVIGPGGTQVCSPVLSSKAFPGTLTNSVVGVKAGPGMLAAVHCYNPAGTEAVLQFFNALPASVVLGTTAPYAVVPIAPGNTGGFALSPLLIGFNVAISVAATTTSSGSTALGTLPDCNVYFN